MTTNPFRFILGLVLFMALLFTPAAMAADGDLDTAGFGAGAGFVTTDFGSTDIGYAVALQSDGKMVVAGVSNDDFAVARYNSDGSLDTNFDSDGYLTTDLSGNNDEAHAVAIQADGKIVVAGQSIVSSNWDFAVVRYNSDGTLDTTFSDDGIVTTNFNSANDYGQAVAIQSDGKIVVAGFARVGSSDDFALVRYNSDGSLDTSFDSDGKVTTNMNNSHDYARAVAIQSDGKIVVVGETHNGSYYNFGVVRYNSDGSLDTSFDTDGKVTTNMNNSHDYGRAVAIQADGKIVVAGETRVNFNYNFGLIRYNSDGSLDTSNFGTDGTVTTNIGSSNIEDYGRAIELQPDGKIVVAGYSGSDFAVGTAIK